MNSSKRTFNALQASHFRYSQLEDADLSYHGNWGHVIQPDTVSSSTWTVESGSATISNESLTDGLTAATITGHVGESIIVNTITTVAGYVDQRIINLKITAKNVPFINNDYGMC
jgi:hypothetical protein